MDVATFRLRNLKILVDRHTKAGKTKKEAAVALDMSASFLSQLLGGKKMGDDVARKIEAAVGLPRGWMDFPPSQDDDDFTINIRPGTGNAPPLVYRGSRPERLDGATLAAATRLARKACENLDLEFDPEDESDAEIVLNCCSYLLERHESIVTVDNLVDFTKRLRGINKGVVADDGDAESGRAGKGPGGKGPTRKVG